MASVCARYHGHDAVRIRIVDRPALVDQERKVTVARDPPGERGVDDRLARGADHRWLFEQFAASARNDRKLGAEAFDVLGLTAKERLGNQQRKVDIRAPVALIR